MTPTYGNTLMGLAASAPTRAAQQLQDHLLRAAAARGHRGRRLRRPEQGRRVRQTGPRQADDAHEGVLRARVPGTRRRRARAALRSILGRDQRSPDHFAASQRRRRWRRMADTAMTTAVLHRLQEFASAEHAATSLRPDWRSPRPDAADLLQSSCWARSCLAPGTPLAQQQPLHLNPVVAKLGREGKTVTASRPTTGRWRTPRETALCACRFRGRGYEHNPLDLPALQSSPR